MEKILELCRQGWQNAHDILDGEPNNGGAILLADAAREVSGALGVPNPNDLTGTGPCEPAAPIARVEFYSGVHWVALEDLGGGMRRLSSNLKAGKEEGEVDADSEAFDNVVDGVELTLLALYDKGVLHVMTQKERDALLAEIADALANHS